MTTKRTTKKRWKSAAGVRLLRLAGEASSVEDAIRLMGRRLLEDVDCPPTDLDALMRKLNVVDAEPRDGLTASGALLKTAEGLKIVYSSDLSVGRQRWTIAHELGHALFETTGPRPPRRGRELERLCDMIAAELLMPWDRFCPLVRAELSVEMILRLAHSFRTSVAATAIRCAEVAGVSVFETERRSVRWGYGVVRTSSDVASRDTLRQTVVDALQSESGSADLILTFSRRTSRWFLQWKRVGSQDRRIFLLYPILADDRLCSSDKPVAPR